MKPPSCSERGGETVSAEESCDSNGEAAPAEMQVERSRSDASPEAKKGSDGEREGDGTFEKRRQLLAAAQHVTNHSQVSRGSSAQKKALKRPLGVSEGFEARRDGNGQILVCQKKGQHLSLKSENGETSSRALISRGFVRGDASRLLSKRLPITVTVSSMVWRGNARGTYMKHAAERTIVGSPGEIERFPRVSIELEDAERFLLLEKDSGEGSHLCDVDVVEKGGEGGGLEVREESGGERAGEGREGCVGGDEGGEGFGVPGGLGKSGEDAAAVGGVIAGRGVLGFVRVCGFRSRCLIGWYDCCGIYVTVE